MRQAQEREMRFQGCCERHFHWGMRRTLGNSRLVTTSIASLFVVPVAAKVLAPFAGNHALDLSWFDPGLEKPISVTIALPFSWRLFYLMFWLFAIGQVVYWVACPTIVRKYAVYGDYRRDHAGPIQLKIFLSYALLRASEDTRRKIMNVVGVGRSGPMPPDVAYDAIEKTLRYNANFDTEGSEIPQNRVFDAVKGVEQSAR